jgi:radical SAM protein with 4Fe4S-binding SPASM domain
LKPLPENALFSIRPLNTGTQKPPDFAASSASLAYTQKRYSISPKGFRMGAAADAGKLIKKLYRYGHIAKNAVIKPTTVQQLPEHIQLEITTYCNQDCLSCGRRDIIHDPKHMSFDQFKTIYDDIQPSNINLSGLGEPLMNPAVFDMIKYARQHGSIVNFPTNLTLGERVIKKLIDSQIDQIKVSIDAVENDTYMIVRQSDKLDNVKRNIDTINRIKEEEGLSYPEIRLNYAFQAANMDELVDLVEFAHKNKIATIYVQDLNYFSVENEKEQLCGFTKEHLIEVLEAADNKAQEYGIDTNIGNWHRNLDEFYNKTLPATDFDPNDTRCTFPWVSAFIDVHGNVLPCPVFVWEKESDSLGNCLERPFSEIWNSASYQQLRREFKQNIRVNPICKRCVPPNIFDMKLIFQKMLLRG